jgi:hypothetical protein
MIAHHPSLTTLAIELAIVAFIVAGSGWLWVRERRRRRRRSAEGVGRVARMRDVDGER